MAMKVLTICWQMTIGDGIADGEIDNTEILEAIADGIADRMDMSDPESVSTASDIVFETMYAYRFRYWFGSTG